MHSLPDHFFALNALVAAVEQILQQQNDLSFVLLTYFS